jgi:hypothetical protein
VVVFDRYFPVVYGSGIKESRQSVETEVCGANARFEKRRVACCAKIEIVENGIVWIWITLASPP